MLSKGMKQALSDSKTVDDFISRVAEPTRAKKKKSWNRGCNQVGLNGKSLCENLLNKGKIYCGARGLKNPTKLNISVETLNTLKDTK